MAVEVGMELIFVDAFSVCGIEFDNLPNKRPPVSIGTCHGFEWVRTPPDFAIFRTAIRLPYVLCISTLSFSWPTTRITLTKDGVVSIQWFY